MKVIYKYELSHKCDFDENPNLVGHILRVPRSFEMLHVDTDGVGSICFWGAVDREDDTVEEHGIYVFPTGAGIDEVYNDNDCRFLATVIDRRYGYVWHLFEKWNGKDWIDGTC